MKNKLVRKVTVCMALLLVALSIIPTVQVTAQSKPENDSTVILEKKDLRILITAKLLSPNIEEKALIQAIINQIYAQDTITQQNISDICAKMGWKLIDSEFEVDDSTFFLFPGLVPSLFVGYIGPVTYGHWVDGNYLDQFCNGFFIGGIIAWGRQGFHQEGRLPIWFSDLEGRCLVGFYKVIED